MASALCFCLNGQLDWLWYLDQFDEITCKGNATCRIIGHCECQAPACCGPYVRSVVVSYSGRVLGTLTLCLLADVLMIKTHLFELPCPNVPINSLDCTKQQPAGIETVSSSNVEARFS
jgi:hypothetical protein